MINRRGFLSRATAAVTGAVTGGGTKVFAAGFGAINTLPASAIIGERDGLLVARFTF